MTHEAKNFDHLVGKLEGISEAQLKAHFGLYQGYVKKLNKPSRRRALIAAYNSFLDALQAPTQPDFSRIDDFAVADDTTDAQRAAGFQINLVKVRIFPSMDFIVIRTEVGTTVNVEEI